MKWTEKQEQTIYTRGKNILVAAAAGSGKTTILIERIKQLILDPEMPVDVDRFLITTFTNAAAAEMKGRMETAIRKAIKELDEADTFDDAKARAATKERLRMQLRKLPKANVSTFHSFTIEVMKKYFYLTDLEPGVKIGDETQMEILKRESIDQTFDRRFAEDYDRFTAWLTKYSKYKNETAIKDSIVAIYKEMRSIPHYMDWARGSAAKLHAESPIQAFGLDTMIEEETRDTLGEAWASYQKAVDLLREEDLELLATKAEENLNILKAIPRYLAESGEFPKISDLKLNQMRAGKDEKESYDCIKNTVKFYREDGCTKKITALRDKYYLIPLDECDAELKAQAEDVDYMIELLEEFEATYKAKKAELIVVDFDDVMHYAIDILSDPTVQKEYREKFEYIFVDEYQDSNKLQEEIVDKISRDNNVFMVGDVKQSIYKFRQAEPELFMARYDKYAQDSEVDSLKIDLNDNFRSKKSVTRTVNAIFKEIMEGYDDNAALHCNVTDEFPGLKTELHIVNKAGYDDKDEMSEAEFADIAEAIINHVDHTEIYDTKTNQWRKAGYGDITVLARGNGTIEQLERYLNNLGIPAIGQSSGGYFETIEVQVFVNMLKIINNTRQDIPLISVMRSVAFDFTARELATIRIEGREGSYYTAVKNYAENGSDEALRKKVQNMFATIDYWKQLKTSVSLEDLVRTVMDTTGYYDYCSGLPVGKQRVSNLRLLIEKAAEFEQANYTGLHGFLSYVDALQMRNVDMAEAKVIGEGEDIVQLMTIHKSKGLEFPIVIVAGMGKNLNAGKKSGTISMHPDYSLALPSVNKAEAWKRDTLLQKAIAARKKREFVAEEIRILYVALTRAKDQLILMGTVNDIEKLNDDVPTMTSFMSMVYPILNDCDFCKLVPVMSGDSEIGIEVMDAPKGGDPDALIKLAREHRDEKKMAEIDKRLSYVYPYEDKGIKSKYSVSQLNHMGQEDSQERMQLRRGLFTEGKRYLTAAEVGTAMHAVMERMDFARALAEGAEYISAKADQMVDIGQLTPQERAAINIDNLTSFFGTDLGARAASSSRLYKEREFILCKDIQGINTVVQGIIDCYFVEDDGIVLIDYKNSRLDDDTTEEVIQDRYREQILLYQEALEGATGLPVKESYLYLFNLQKFTQIT